jgi:hypothetical protein
MPLQCEHLLYSLHAIGAHYARIDLYFQLYRTVLRRNSAFFRDMFSLPQPADRKEANGQNDDQLVVCHDPLEIFRAWCSVLYSGYGVLLSTGVLRHI